MAAAAGLAAVLLGGLCNGTWPLVTKPTAPPWLTAVSDGGWQWENAWLSLMVSTVAVNAAACAALAGPSALAAVYDAVDPVDVVLVVVFSVLWGLGGIGYGQAIDKLGTALGTSLVMGLIIAIGTALPALVAPDELDTTQTSVAFVGVLVALAGFGLSALAGRARDGAQASAQDKGQQLALGVAWAVSGAVLSSLLQFAFVLGDALSDAAEDEGLGAGVRAVPIWLIAFSFSSVSGAGYASYLLTRNRTWDRFYCVEPCRNAAKCAGAAVGFVAHIHLYGAGAALFGDLGAVFAWPLIMSSTVLAAQAWSVRLGEFAGAPANAVRLNRSAVAALVVAVVLVGVAGSVSTSDE